MRLLIACTFVAALSAFVVRANYGADEHAPASGEAHTPATTNPPATPAPTAPPAPPEPSSLPAPSASNPHPLTELLSKTATTTPTRVMVSPKPAEALKSDAAVTTSTVAMPQLTPIEFPSLRAASDRPTSATMRMASPAPAPKMNVNSASVEELAALPGMDLTRARNIVEFRLAHGLFESIGDVSRVQGISDRVLARLLPLLDAKPVGPTATRLPSP